MQETGKREKETAGSFQGLGIRGQGLESRWQETRSGKFPLSNYILPAVNWILKTAY